MQAVEDPVVRLRVRVVDVQRVPDAAAVAHAEVEHLHQAGPEWLLEHPQSMVVMLLLLLLLVVVVIKTTTTVDDE